MENKLKPCPRCRKDDAELLHNDGFDVFNSKRYYKLRCRHCGYQTKISVYVDEVVTWWNEETEKGG